MLQPMGTLRAKGRVRVSSIRTQTSSHEVNGRPASEDEGTGNASVSSSHRRGNRSSKGLKRRNTRSRASLAASRPLRWKSGFLSPSNDVKSLLVRCPRDPLFLNSSFASYNLARDKYACRFACIAHLFLLLCLFFPLSLHNSECRTPLLKPAHATSLSVEDPQEGLHAESSPDCSLFGTTSGAEAASSCLLTYSFDTPDPLHLLRTTPKEIDSPLDTHVPSVSSHAPVWVSVSARRRLSLQDSSSPIASGFPAAALLRGNTTEADLSATEKGYDPHYPHPDLPSLQEGPDADQWRPSPRLLSDAEIFDFAVRRLQGFGSLFGGSGAGGSADRGVKKRGGGGFGGLDYNDGEDLLNASPTPGGNAGAGGSSGGRKVLMSNGLVCEDDARVEDFGAKCKLIARSLGGRLGCEKKLSEIAPDGQLPPTIPAFSRVADACPLTCGLCEECAPGCALWFLGNTLCDEACNNALCQFDGGDCWSADCVVSDWGDWSSCSVSCGGPGTEKRTREIKSKPKQGGSPCPKLEETRDGCNANVKCPENCVVSDWGEWGDCSTTCGEGQSRRHREILKHPDTNGQKCPEIEQARVCMKDSCTTACVVSEWSEWGPCGASCGGGERTRKRSIISPPVNGGALCPSLTEDEVCNDFSCDGGCVVGPWSDWSACTAPCGGGTKKRTREVRKKEDAADCPPRRQEAVCNQHTCAIDCAVSDWTAWSACSVTCGEGRESRTRQVTASAQGLGSACPALSQDRVCFAGLCSTECVVSDWGDWGECTATCGFGTRQRERGIMTLPTRAGGAGCPELQESEECFSKCPVSCVVGEWEEWGECADLCHQVGVVEPITTRSRAVLLEAPDCPFSPALIQSQSCAALGFQCDVDCEVSEWGAWSPCSATCGGGQRQRRRALLRSPKGNGKPCPALVDLNACALESCDVVEGQMIAACVYGEWSPFSDCDATCGVGRQRSSRAILAFPSSPFDPDGNILLDSTMCTETDRFQPCQGPPCPVDCQVTAWGAWSSCSVTCGGGQQDRLRSIVRPAANGGKECPVLRQVHTCATYPCPTDCLLSDWTEWSACSAACGIGGQTRTRRIVTPASVDPPGAACGPLAEEKKCFSPRGPCREECALSEWSAWTPCSLSCGTGGVRTSSREILSPGGIGGGRSCAGESLLKEEACNEDVPCVGDCEVGEWGEWTGCSVSCSERLTQEEEARLQGSRQRLLEATAKSRLRDKEDRGEGAAAARGGRRLATAYAEAEAGHKEEGEHETETWGNEEGLVAFASLPSGGKRMRSRAILKPAKNGGNACPVTEEIDEACNADIPCPVECTYTPWTDWTSCSVTCGVGKQVRTREIKTEARFGGQPCENLEDSIDCMAEVLCVDDCEVTDWGEWSSCSATCGGGVRKRGRQVLKPPSNGGRPCPPLTDFDACGLASCHGTDCEVSEWGAWSSCSKPCGGGVHVRTRGVLTEKRGNGRECPSPLFEREGCNLFRCMDSVCEDNPDVPIMTGGVECRVLLAMGCDRLLKDLAEENDREFPTHIPPETRVKDACPMTCGTCAECAPGCQLRDLGNRHCDEACNNSACQMDLGDCGGDCELIKSKKASFFAARGVSIEPPTSTLFKGQTALLSCKDAGMRFSGFPALRQLAVTCRGRDDLEVLPRGLQLQTHEATGGQAPRAKPQREPEEAQDLPLPACVSDQCPFVYIEGFEGDEDGDAEGGRREAEEKKETAKNAPSPTQLNGFYYRGDAQRGYPRYVQDKYSKPKYFLWLHAAEPHPFSAPEARAGPSSSPLSFVWRLTATDPLEATAEGVFADAPREVEPREPHAETLALSAAGVVTRCKAPPVGEDGPLDCIDFWTVGEVRGDGSSARAEKQVPASSIKLRCLSSEAEKEELEASLQRQAALASSGLSSEASEAFAGPPVTVVAGTRMTCEDQPDVERVSQKTCAELKKLLKCDFVLEEAGVDELPDFLPADATLALACPQTCGLCRECAFRCPLWFLGNRHCDEACNNEACEFDRGDCDPGSAESEASETRDSAATLDAQGYRSRSAEKGLLPAGGAGAGGRRPRRLRPAWTTPPDAQLPPGIPKTTRVKDACPKSCDACMDDDLLRRPSASATRMGTAPEARGKGSSAAASCEDDPAVREMGYTCKLLLAVAQEDGRGGCNARLLDLDPKKQELPPAIPKITRVKDACPKTCNACDDPDRLVRPSASPAATCEDDPLVKSMGYTCKLLVRAAEEYEGCNTRLVALKPDQVLPPGVPEQTRVKDACSKTCNACDDPDRLVRPNVEDPATACVDHPLAESLGYTCKLLLSVAATEDLGGCEAQLRALQRPGEKLPNGLPDDARVKDACPRTCRACDDPSLLVAVEKEKKEDQPCLGDCCDVPMLEQQTGYTCKQIKAFVGDDCSVFLKDLSSAPLPPQVPPAATLEDACPFTCGACSTHQCNDNPLVEAMGYTCGMIISAAEGRGGCDALLRDLAPPDAAPFPPPEIPPNTRVKDACMRSCHACPASRDTDQAAACHDDPRLPQMGYSCEAILPYASRGCATILRDLLPSTALYADGVDPSESLATYCRLSCGICVVKSKSRHAGSKNTKPGCRNNPLVEAHGFSCSLLVKASSLGCNAKLKDLSDAPLPPGIPSQTKVKDACLLECGGCIEVPTCYDGFQNGDEEGVDCGGPCRPCQPCSPSLFKELGDAYVITDGRGTQHGALRELRCAEGHDRIGGKEPEVLVCQDGLFPAPTLKCDVRKVEVQYGTLTIDGAGDLGPEAVPSLYFALLHALHLTTPYELRLLAAGTERRSREALMGADDACRDDPRVEQMGYACSLLSSFCEAELHALAESQGKQLPPWLPKGARVKDACSATCGACGRRRRLASLSASSPRKLAASSLRPLLLDYGVVWTTPNLPFSSRFTEETPALFLNSLYSQFLDRNLALVNRQDGTLQSAAAALRQRPFLVAFEAPTPLRLSLKFWNKGFGAFSPPEVARGLFAVAGLPLPTAQDIRFGLHVGLREAKSKTRTPKAKSRPGLIGEVVRVSPHAEVQYALTNEKKTLIPLHPGLGQLVGACESLEAQRDPDNCCGFHTEMQALLDGPCGVHLYTQRLSPDSVQAFCSGRVADRRCLSSFLLLLDFYRRRPGVGCGVYLTLAERVFDAWCARDAADGRFCFAEIEKTLESLEDGPGYLATKPSDELNKTCQGDGCYMRNIRYLDAITQLQVAWKLLGGGVLQPTKGGGAGDRSAAMRQRDRREESYPQEEDQAEAERLEGAQATGASRSSPSGASSSLRRLQRPGEETGDAADEVAKGSTGEQPSDREGTAEEEQEKEAEASAARTTENMKGNSSLRRQEGQPPEKEDDARRGEKGSAEDRGEKAREGSGRAGAARLIPKGRKDEKPFPSLRSSVARRLAPSVSPFSSPPSSSMSTSAASASAASPASSWARTLEAHATRRDRAYHAIARRLHQSVATAAEVLGIPLDGPFVSSSPSSPSVSGASSAFHSARSEGAGPESDYRSPVESPLAPASAFSSVSFISSFSAPSTSPRALSAPFPASPLHAAVAAPVPSPPRRLKGLEPRLATRFEGPLGESLEEMVSLMCTKVDGDFCQQTLVLLAEESPVKNPALVIQPCSSRCFVPITGLLGSLVESYGERYRDPFHRALGKIMRAYGRFYCTANEAGQICGEILFNKLKTVEVPAFTPQGLDVNLTQCACPQSFVQDGQCDRSCFNEACGWDGQDCFVRRMFPEVYEALLSLVSPQCSAFSASFECTSRCRKQYEHLLLSQDKNCCMAAGFELLSSLLAVETAHPLFEEEERWAPARSLAHLEQLCGLSLDRTCSLGRPRQQVLLVTLLAGGLQAEVLLADAAKLREIEEILRKSIAQKLALVDQDVTRTVARHAPGGIEVQTFLDAGIYTDRTLLAIQNQSTLRQIDEAILRRLGGLVLEPYRDLEQKAPLTVQTSRLPATRTIQTPAVSSAAAPALPFAGTWGVNDLPVDLPRESCSVADLHRFLLPGYALALGSAAAFASPAAARGSEASPNDAPQTGARSRAATDGGAAASKRAHRAAPEPRFPFAASAASDSRRGEPDAAASRRGQSPRDPASPPAGAAPAAAASPAAGRRLQAAALERFPQGLEEGVAPSALALAPRSGQRAWYAHGEGEAVRCAPPYAPIRGSAIDRVVCDNGSWTLENLLVCKRDCPRASQYFSAASSGPLHDPSPPAAAPAAAPASGSTSPYRVAEDAETHGSVVEVFCADGFSPADFQVSPSRFECVDSRWVGRTLHCAPLCPAFPDLGAAYTVQGEGRAHGDRRVVACARGFYPQHRSFTSICEASRWTPPLFECTEATPPDMNEGATGLQKIQLQMFSSEGVLGLVIFSVLVTLAALAVFIAWRLYYRKKARQNFIAREETVQALKVSSLGLGAPARNAAEGCDQPDILAAHGHVSFSAASFFSSYAVARPPGAVGSYSASSLSGSLNEVRRRAEDDPTWQGRSEGETARRGLVPGYAATRSVGYRRYEKGEGEEKGSHPSLLCAHSAHRRLSPSRPVSSASSCASSASFTSSSQPSLAVERRAQCPLVTETPTPSPPPSVAAGGLRASSRASSSLPAIVAQAMQGGSVSSAGADASTFLPSSHLREPSGEVERENETDAQGFAREWRG
ncbi:hypothetical protein BESB_055340 [Besnoitia besnoiti]|uniref:LNR domain-containing protein n=1 Tax=Besnoitia besnoiti TaxID=94643 RepID=A0A2A9MJQ1_BESBE|nr:hypothetical protein BESB_055340 [Besnoitia besnoiti]PFH35883.1 hypothetical protein BESB_055340 [Besnoitia besnoiti]